MFEWPIEGFCKIFYFINRQQTIQQIVEEYLNHKNMTREAQRSGLTI